MSKTTWVDVEKGDVVDLNGREWTVTKLKPKGKRLAVKLAHKGRTADGEVKLADGVKIAKRRADVDPVQDREGAQRRWASEAELKRELSRGLPAGDSARRKPPEKAKGAKWDAKPADAAEKAVTKILGARLVGESKNEAAGYYVPPVDASTVAAHLALFHGTDPSTLSANEMRTVHEGQHIGAEREGAPLAVNHWHTEKRP